jgi:tetratricopeptide (TPR) repeat protein
MSSSESSFLLELGARRYRLDEDLQRLHRVARAGAPEATVFYCARVLEATAAAEVYRLTAEEPATVFASLSRLDELGVTVGVRLACFHALRRLGNEARHVHHSMSETESTLALALLERVLTWKLKEAPDLAGVLNALFPQAGDSGTRALRMALAGVDRERPDAEALRRLWEQEVGSLTATTLVPSLYADVLVCLDHPAEALAIVQGVRERFGDDLRLRQLEGWTLRLVGRVDEALAKLEHLHRQYPQDEETSGLLAGTYKTLWRQTASPEHLRKAALVYEKAWTGSKETHTYVGINAATLALLSGRPAVARAIAMRILALAEERKARICTTEVLPLTGYWDKVTLAEAELLSGGVPQSQALYREARAAYPNHKMYWRTTEAQLRLILPALGLDAEEFLTGACADGP